MDHVSVDKISKWEGLLGGSNGDVDEVERVL